MQGTPVGILLPQLVQNPAPGLFWLRQEVQVGMPCVRESLVRAPYRRTRDRNDQIEEALIFT